MADISDRARRWHTPNDADHPKYRQNPTQRNAEPAGRSARPEPSAPKPKPRNVSLRGK